MRFMMTTVALSLCLGLGSTIPVLSQPFSDAEHFLVRPWISDDDSAYEIEFQSNSVTVSYYGNEEGRTGSYKVQSACNGFSPGPYDRGMLIIVEENIAVCHYIMTLTARQLTLMYTGRGNILSFQREVKATRLQGHIMTSRLFVLEQLYGGPHPVIMSLLDPSGDVLTSTATTVTGDGVSITNDAIVDFGIADDDWQIRSIRIEADYGTFTIQAHLNVLHETPLHSQPNDLISLLINRA